MQALGGYLAWRGQRDLVVVDGRTPFFTDHLGRRLTRFTTEYAFQCVRRARPTSYKFVFWDLAPGRRLRPR